MGHTKSFQIQVFGSDQGLVKEKIQETGRMKPHPCGTIYVSKNFTINVKFYV